MTLKKISFDSFKVAIRFPLRKYLKKIFFFRGSRQKRGFVTTERFFFYQIDYLRQFKMRSIDKKNSAVKKREQEWFQK